MNIRNQACPALAIAEDRAAQQIRAMADAVERIKALKPLIDKARADDARIRAGLMNDYGNPT